MRPMASHREIMGSGLGMGRATRDFRCTGGGRKERKRCEGHNQ